MGKTIILIAIFFICLMGNSGCKPKFEQLLQITNNSDVGIVILSASNYPDTLNVKFDGCSVEQMVAKNSTRKLYTHLTSWPSKIERSKNKVLSLYIYDSDSAIYYLKLGGCDTLTKRRDLILKRIDMDINYLNAHQYHLVFP